MNTSALTSWTVPYSEPTVLGQLYLSFIAGFYKVVLGNTPIYFGESLHDAIDVCNEYR